jgi:tagatose 1,6-diphosphate aldolase
VVDLEFHLGFHGERDPDRNEILLNSPQNRTRQDIRRCQQDPPLWTTAVSIAEWGLPAAKRRAKGSGLLLAYEKTGYDKTLPGRLPDLLDLWSVKRLKEAGANCVKILLYYTPYDDQKINDHKHAWTERIGDECKADDIPFFLELVGYKEGLDEKGAEYAKLKPEVVAKSMEEFSKDRYGVDVLKVEVPVNLQFVEGAKSFKGTKAYSKKEALDHYRAAAGATGKLFIYLSAGVSNAEFIEDLEFAAESGVKFNGVLCGRATWKDAMPIFCRRRRSRIPDSAGHREGEENQQGERLKAALPGTGPLYEWKTRCGFCRVGLQVS